MTLIECKNVCLSYEDNIVCENLNFKVNEGDFLCIVGENGSGKTTLMKAVLGLKNITCGEIVFDKSITGSQIGYLPQQKATQKDFPASVYEVVLSGCISKKKSKLFFSHELKELAVQSMEKLDILDLKKRCYRELSGGQQQRVLLARALCAANKLILLDEPVTGLDPIATADFYRLIEMLNTKYGMTVIMISHDVFYAARHASHILHMSKTDALFDTAENYLCSDLFKSYERGATVG